MIPLASLHYLIIAWGNGEDCYFAINDALLELGFWRVAEKHKYCDGGLCDLYLWAKAGADMRHCLETSEARLEYEDSVRRQRKRV